MNVGCPAALRMGAPVLLTIGIGGRQYIAKGPGSVGSRNGDVVRRAYMGLAMMSSAHPRMLLWGQLRHCKVHWMWRRRLRKFLKFECSAIDGRFAHSAATSSYVIVVSILLRGSHTQGGNLLVFCIC
jgi:hypothetical protein